MKMPLIGPRFSVTAMALAALLLPASLAGQGLADFDYENLAFRGVGLEGGYILPTTKVEPTYSFGARMDLGYLGPGLRIVPGFSYWSSSLKRSEVSRLERKLETLIGRELDPGVPVPTVDLGEIDWSDIVLSMDGHFVWAVPLDVLTYAGLGISVHILNGEGQAISDTFVEDLLDTVTAGLNVHAGLEYPVNDRFRLYGVSRYEMVEDIQYLEFRIGGQIMIGPPAPGEERGGR